MAGRQSSDELRDDRICFDGSRVLMRTGLGGELIAKETRRFGFEFLFEFDGGGGCVKFLFFTERKKQIIITLIYI